MLPPNHPIVHRVFHYLSHPFWGVYHPYFWFNIHISDDIDVMFKVFMLHVMVQLESWRWIREHPEMWTWKNVRNNMPGMFMWSMVLGNNICTTQKKSKKLQESMESSHKPPNLRQWHTAERLEWLRDSFSTMGRASNHWCSLWSCQKICRCHVSEHVFYGWHMLKCWSTILCWYRPWLLRLR